MTVESPTYRFKIFWDPGNPAEPDEEIENDYVAEVPNVSRGRDSDSGEVEAGQMTILLRNDDKRFTPTNAASPYFGYMRRGVEVELTADAGLVTEAWDDPPSLFLLEAVRQSAANTKVSMGFAVPTAMPNGGALRVWLRRVGNPAGNAWLELYDDDGTGPPGKPNTLLETLNTIPCSTLSAVDFHEQEWPFTTALAAGTPYHLVMAGDWPVDGVNYVQLGVG